MFKILEGKLLLSSNEVVQKINETTAAELSQMTQKKISKLFFFCKNYSQILNPVTALIWNKKILEIHPGHFRLIAAHIMERKTLDAILVTDNEYDVKSFASDINPVKDIRFYKQLGADWWQITTKGQAYFLNNKNYSRMNENFISYWKREVAKIYGSITWYSNNKNIAESIINESRKHTYIFLENELDLYKNIAELAKYGEIKTFQKQISYPKKNTKKLPKSLSEKASESIKKGSFNIKEFKNRTNDLDSWKAYFQNNNLYLVDLSSNQFNNLIEPITSFKKHSEQDKKSKYSDWVNIGYTKSFAEYLDEFRKLESCLKNFDQSICNLVGNGLWNIKGYEWLQLIKSGYENGVITHGCTVIHSKNFFETHPGRHSTYARRFLNQADLHWVTVPKKHVEWFENLSAAKIISKINSINEILELIPDKVIGNRIWLQGSIIKWPFIVCELSLPESDWGELDGNNQVTISEYNKEKLMKIYKEWAEKVKQGYDVKQDYQIRINIPKHLVYNFYLAFLLTEQQEDSIFIKLRK